MSAVERTGGSDAPLDQLADGFAELAASISRRAPQATVLDVLERTRRHCEAAAGRATGEPARLVANLRIALETWQRVWPRLGEQQEFRQAVAREAELWSRRLKA